jgi:hypothetical protein
MAIENDHGVQGTQLQAAADDREMEVVAVMKLYSLCERAFEWMWFGL